MNDAPPDANVIVFGFSTGFRQWMLIAVIGFLCIVSFYLFGLYYELIHDGGWLIEIVIIGGIAFFGLLAIIAAVAWSKSSDRVSLDDSEITFLPHRGTAMSIRWNEVDKVDAHDVMKRLTITGVSGTKRINLEYQLEDFARLRDIVLTRTSEQRDLSPAAREFYRNYTARLQFFVAIPLVTIWGCLGLYYSRSPVALGFFGLQFTRYMLSRANQAK
jgi:hypothetical protein